MRTTIIVFFLICAAIPSAAAEIQWGRLALADGAIVPIRGVYLYPGGFRDGLHGYYENETPAKNTDLYTVRPAHKPPLAGAPEGSPLLGWSVNSSYRTSTVAAIRAIGANVIYFSHWGIPTTHWGGRGSDRWVRWAPMQSSVGASDELFETVSATQGTTSTPLYLIPAIECSPGTNKTSPYHFTSDFPHPPTGTDLAPQLYRQLRQLIHHYLIDDRAKQKSWPALWARIVGHDGQLRHAVFLRQVASSSLRHDDHELFARSFDLLARKLAIDTGIRIGFIVELLPHERKPPQGATKDTYRASVYTGRALAATDSILAVQGFLSEQYLTNDEARALTKLSRLHREEELLARKAAYMRQWQAAGLPTILDISPGYDNSKRRKQSLRYGYDDQWLNWQSEITDATLAGVVLTTWNDLTRGMIFVRASGSLIGAGDKRATLVPTWTERFVSTAPSNDQHWHFVSAQATHHVTGTVCQKWKALGGSHPSGALGEPEPTVIETATSGVRAHLFANGAIYSFPSGKSYAVYGRIWRRYDRLERETGELGLPTSDQHRWYDGQAFVERSLFIGGAITLSPTKGIQVTLGQ